MKGFFAIDPQLALPQVRAQIESLVGVVAKGKIVCGHRDAYFGPMCGRKDEVQLCTLALEECTSQQLLAKK